MTARTAVAAIAVAALVSASVFAAYFVLGDFPAVVVRGPQQGESPLGPNIAASFPDRRGAPVPPGLPAPENLSQPPGRLPDEMGRSMIPSAPESGVDGADYLTAEERRNIAVYEHSYRSVVHVSTHVVQIDRFFRTTMQGEGNGSGSVLDAEGHILTNYHVIEGASRLTVTLFNGKQFEAELVGQDPPNDMAILKIDAPDEMLFPVELGHSMPLRVGQKVYAIGSPFGLDRSMTVGIVSSLGRSVPTHNHRVLKSMIQVDAALNRGNSGGPLLDSRGMLVGMNTAIASSTGENTGVGFAIPVDTIRRVAALLIRDGRVIRPSLGISAYIQSPSGLIVGQLVPDGPADRAGLRGVRIIRQRTYFGEQRSVDIDYADTILAVEGQPVHTLDDLMSVIETLRPGQTARLSVLRDGKAIPVPIVLGEDTGE